MLVHQPNVFPPANAICNDTNFLTVILFYQAIITLIIINILRK